MISICNLFIHWSHKYYLKPKYVWALDVGDTDVKISIPEFSGRFIISLVLDKTIE